MTIWIDPPAWPAHGTLWSHLISDLSYAELHEFAAAQGVSRRAFEGDHYDVPQDRHAQLVAAGAQPVAGSDLVRILRGSGLRIQKRTRERVVASRVDAAGLPPGSRIDVIASRQDTAPAGTVSVRLAVARDRDGLLVVAGPDGRPDLPSSVVGDGDAARALRDLRSQIVGDLPPGRARLVGYVRYWVTAADHDYPWPRPAACFAVYRESGQQSGTNAGRWVSWRQAGAELGDRDWWPLVDGPEGGEPQ